MAREMKKNFAYVVFRRAPLLLNTHWHKDHPVNTVHKAIQDHKAVEAKQVHKVLKEAVHVKDWILLEHSYGICKVYIFDNVTLIACYYGKKCMFKHPLFFI